MRLLSEPFGDAAPLPATALLHLTHRMLEAHGGGGGEGGELSRGNDLLTVLPLVHGLALDLLRALLRAGRHHLVSVRATLSSPLVLLYGLETDSRSGWMATESGGEVAREEELPLWRAGG